MKTFLVTLLLALSIPTSEASVKRFYEQVRLPGQDVMNRQSIENPVAAETNDVATALQGPTSASAITVTAGLSNPDVPRNLVITPGTSTGDVGACTITVAGTNIHGGSITEDFAFLNNASSATTGAKAFKTVSSVAFAANCEDTGFAATWSIGVGEKIGADRCMTSAGHLVFSTIDGAYETTRATVAADADEVEKNTFDFNGTMDGSSDFEAFFVQNFRCLP